MITYNSFIDSLEANFATPHLQIKKFDEGFFTDMAVWMTRNELWPIMWIVPQDITHLPNSVSEYNCRVYFLDLLEKDESNERDVLSDQQQTARDFTNWLRENEGSGFNLLRDPSTIPVKSIGMDFTAGWYTNVSIEVNTEMTECAIPFDPNLFPPAPPSCPVSYVQNSDGSYEIQLASGDVLILPDINISSTEGAYQVDIPSVQNFVIPDVEWTDSDGTPMTSEYSLPIVCTPVSPSNLLINGVQSEVINGGTSFNLIALLNGIPDGTYNAAIDTLSFTTDPLAVRWDYIEVSETQYIGFGYASTTDSDIITIKRNIRNPSTGVITTAYATDTWTNHLTATYT